MQQLNRQRQKLIDDYEGQLSITLDKHDADDIRKKIVRLKEQMTEEKEFKQNSEEMMLSALEERGMRLTPSGRFITKTGRLYTYDEAEHLGLLDNIEKSHLKRIFKCYEPSETTHTIITSTLSSVGKMDFANTTSGFFSIALKHKKNQN